MTEQLKEKLESLFLNNLDNYWHIRPVNWSQIVLSLGVFEVDKIVQDWNRLIGEKYGCKRVVDDFESKGVQEGYVSITHPYDPEIILVPSDFAEKVLVLGGLP